MCHKEKNISVEKQDQEKERCVLNWKLNKKLALTKLLEQITHLEISRLGLGLSSQLLSAHSFNESSPISALKIIERSCTIYR